MSLLEDALGVKLGDCKSCNQHFGSPFGAEPLEYGGAAPAAPLAKGKIGVQALAQGSVILGAGLGTGLSAAAIYALGGKWTMLLAPVMGVFLAVPLAAGAITIAVNLEEWSESK